MRIMVVALCAACLGVLGAQQNQPGIPVQTVVTVEPRHDKSKTPELHAGDLTVASGKEWVDVLDLVPATGDHAAMQLFLLMDDSSNTNIGTQFTDLKRFIQALPGTTAIGIGYMRNGTVLTAQEFTTDHAAAAAKLRLPLGSPGASASPWFAISDLMKRWPTFDGRREILMISDGIDRYYGDGPDNPYVNSAVEQAQRAGVVVNAIYWGGAGHSAHSFSRLNWGQSYLSEIADQTGGEQYYQGFDNPVAFAPYLDDLTRRMSNQYLLTFRAKPRSKAGVERIRVTAELPDAEVVAATQVWVPAS